MVFASFVVINLLLTLAPATLRGQDSLEVTPKSIVGVHLDDRGRAFLRHEKAVEVRDLASAKWLPPIEVGSIRGRGFWRRGVFRRRRDFHFRVRTDDLRFRRRLQLAGQSEAFTQDDRLAQLAGPASDVRQHVFGTVKVKNNYSLRRVVRIDLQSGAVEEILPPDDTLGHVGLSHSGGVLFTQRRPSPDPPSEIGRPTFFRVTPSGTLGEPLPLAVEGGLTELCQPRAATYFVANNRLLLGPELKAVAALERFTIIPDFGADRIYVGTRSKILALELTNRGIRPSKTRALPPGALEALRSPSVMNPTPSWQALTVGDRTHLVLGS